ncbi:beta-propeller fold lactonase family protein [Smaragdicoccus niigatensis]|uniref:beta-propeller fold lactonase family protein n=1 Tax=Smaragdicoccus niigatensis TaxID=359359 RepID=UPI000381B0A5|nr:beta-propeller fold lactonase family protein [Smaragdicoccus niigatensis]
MHPRPDSSAKFLCGIAFAGITTTVSTLLSAGVANADTVTTTIAVGNEPRDVAVSPDGSHAYVSNGSSDSVSVIDTATNTVTGTLSVGSGPRDLAVSPDGKTLYVANSASNTISLVDVASTAAVNYPVGNLPQGLSLKPDGTAAYVTNLDSNSVSVFDIASKTVTATISVGSQPRDVAFSKDGTRAYVTNLAQDSVSVIDTATNKLIDANGPAAGTNINVGDMPANLAVSPDGSLVYVADQASNSVSVINTATYAVSNIPVVGDPSRVTFTPDGSRAYVTESNGDAIAIIDTATQTVAGTVSVGTTPLGVAFTPDGKTGYVANYGTNSVSVLKVQVPPTVSGDPSAGMVGQEYTFAFTTAGMPAPVVTTDSTLPAGLTLSPEGVLYGTPTESGSFPVSITASNGVNPDAHLAVTLLIDAAPSISGEPPNGQTGQGYSFSFAAAGYPVPTVSTSSPLPKGLHLSSSGVLSGTPTEGGTYPLTITASNGTNPPATLKTTIVVTGESVPCAFGSLCDLGIG